MLVGILVVMKKNDRKSVCPNICGRTLRFLCSFHLSLAHTFISGLEIGTSGIVSIIDISHCILKTSIQNSLFDVEEYLGQTHLDIERLNGQKLGLSEDQHCSAERN